MKIYACPVNPEKYPAFEKRAAACSAKLVRSMLRRLA